MKKHVATNMPAGRLTILAALLAGLSTSASATSPDLVISQVFTGGGSGGATYSRDFIELFNRGTVEVQLKGKSLQYASATGTWSSRTELPEMLLKPGQYYLVGGTPGSSGGDIGTVDHSWGVGLQANNAKVALSNQTALMTAANQGAATIDMIGYGTANLAEGTAAPTPSITTMLARKGAGCTDSDNNGSDFEIVDPTLPRRSSTLPLNVCSGGGTDPVPVPVAQPIVPVCPASLQIVQGSAGSAAITASDKDSIVNSAVLASAAVAGIELRNVVAASAIGASASASLEVAAGVAAGNYPVTINFANNDGQNASCSVSVRVAGVVTIPQIQGTEPKSAYANSVQTTQGVVTAIVGSGYFLQDPNGDGDPATSDGLFVFGSSAGVAVGDLVRVTGTVTEYTPSGAPRSYTELTNLTATSKIGTGSITPANIEMPTDLAQVEGMLVRFTTPLVVNGNGSIANRGELVLSSGRREIPTNRHVPGSDEARALAKANAADVIVLDDGIFVTPPSIPYLFQDGTVRSGDTVTGLTGVVDYGASGDVGAAFKLQPTETPRFSRTNERIPSPVIAAGNVRVASANVLNFFTEFTNGTDAWGRASPGCKIGTATRPTNCRGADNLAEFVRQRDKIVDSLVAVNADVVGLMEIQNNDDVAVSYLAEQLNARMGAGTYAVVPKPGATGTDAIRVAMIYKPKSVSLVGNVALSDGHPDNNRAPIAATFKAANGGKFSLVVNHLKSKGGCNGATGGDADSGDGQGCWNATRVEQAARLRDYFLPQVVAAANDSDVLVVGDMNAYGMEDPIRLLNAAGYVNEIERHVRPHGIPYSYVFGAESGYLDHALASSSLSPQVAGVTEWHNNADEPEAIDYNIESGTGADPYQAGPYRASDHDPVVISLNLAPTFADVSASATMVRSALMLNRVTGKYHSSVKITNTGSTALNGPLHLVLQGLTAGITLEGKSGEQNGSPYLTLPNASLAPGASVTVTTIFNNPSKTSLGYTPKLFSGTF